MPKMKERLQEMEHGSTYRYGNQKCTQYLLIHCYEKPLASIDTI